MYKHIKANRVKAGNTGYNSYLHRSQSWNFSVHSFCPCALYGDAYKFEQSKRMQAGDQKQKYVQLGVALMVQCLVRN